MNDEQQDDQHEDAPAVNPADAKLRAELDGQQEDDPDRPGEQADEEERDRVDPLDGEEERDQHQEGGRGDAGVDPVGRRVVREVGAGELAVRACAARSSPASYGLPRRQPGEHRHGPGLLLGRGLLHRLRRSARVDVHLVLAQERDDQRDQREDEQEIGVLEERVRPRVLGPLGHLPRPRAGARRRAEGRVILEPLTHGRRRGDRLLQLVARALGLGDQEDGAALRALGLLPRDLVAGPQRLAARARERDRHRSGLHSTSKPCLRRHKSVNARQGKSSEKLAKSGGALPPCIALRVGLGTRHAKPSPAEPLDDERDHPPRPDRAGLDPAARGVRGLASAGRDRVRDAHGPRPGDGARRDADRRADADEAPAGLLSAPVRGRVADVPRLRLLRGPDGTVGRGPRQGPCLRRGDLQGPPPAGYRAAAAGDRVQRGVRRH